MKNDCIAYILYVIIPLNSVNCLLHISCHIAFIFVLTFHILLISSAYCRIFKLTPWYMIYLIGVSSLVGDVFPPPAARISGALSDGQDWSVWVHWHKTKKQHLRLHYIKLSVTPFFPLNIFISFSTTFICYILKWLWNQYVILELYKVMSTDASKECYCYNLFQHRGEMFLNNLEIVFSHANPLNVSPLIS